MKLLLPFLVSVYLVTQVRAEVAEHQDRGRGGGKVEGRAERKCNETGWRCYQDCTGLENGFYQWCGACTHALMCSGGITAHYDCTEDRVVDIEEYDCVDPPSSTCSECWTEACGGSLHHLEDYKYELPEGWDAMCYITKNDTDVVDEPCAELIKDMKGLGGGAQEFVDAGGSFGCWRAKGSLNGNFNDGCREKYQDNIDLHSCEECNIMAVCMKHPKG